MAEFGVRWKKLNRVLGKLRGYVNGAVIRIRCWKLVDKGDTHGSRNGHGAGVGDFA
jgi:hypothetical protein